VIDFLTLVRLVIVVQVVQLLIELSTIDRIRSLRRMPAAAVLLVGIAERSSSPILTMPFVASIGHSDVPLYGIPG
jgi:hypothetical protein